MIAWPTRGQKAPNFWDEQLKTYIDESGSLLVVSGGSVNLPDYDENGDTLPVLGYLVTETTAIEGRNFDPGVYVFYADPSAYGGWKSVVVDGTGVALPPGPADETPPAAGTLASSTITETGFTLTVSGASDAVGLASSPYAFSTDNGSTWTAYQSSAVYNATGKTSGTPYQCKHRVRDAAGNVITGSAISVTPIVPSGWHATFTDALTSPLGEITARENWAIQDINNPTYDHLGIDATGFYATGGAKLYGSNPVQSTVGHAIEFDYDFVSGGGGGGVLVRIASSGFAGHRIQLTDAGAAVTIALSGGGGSWTGAGPVGAANLSNQPRSGHFRAEFVQADNMIRIFVNSVLIAQGAPDPVNYPYGGDAPRAVDVAFVGLANTTTKNRFANVVMETYT